MRTIITILCLIFSFSIFSQTKKTEITNKELLVSVKTLENKNRDLEVEILKLQVKNESTSAMIDKVDNMYNNNFLRFSVFWTVIAGVVTVLLPYMINDTQKKIIELKKKEIFDYSNAEIQKLEQEIKNDLSIKYKELNDLIIQSNEGTSKALKDEFIKSKIYAQYLAYKINELDGNLLRSWNNLGSAITMSSKIKFYEQIEVMSKATIRIVKLCKEKNIVLGKQRIEILSRVINSLKDEGVVQADTAEELMELLDGYGEV